jgi:hypothetical protein
LIKAAEEKASETCEVCGRPGELCCTLAQSSWYQTLCQEHAHEKQYVKAAEFSGLWEKVEPYYLQRRRVDWQERNADKKFVVLSSDQEKKLGVDATYIRDPKGVSAIIGGAWDGVFIGSDEVGMAYIAALEEHYKDVLAENSAAREGAWANGKNVSAPPLKEVPDLHYFHERVEVPRMLWQDLGTSCWTCQDYFFKPGPGEAPVGSEAELEKILRNIYS